VKFLNNFAPEKRAQEQQQIAQQVEQQLIKPVAETQAANDINSRATGNVSQDYDAARIASNARQMKNAEALARLLGKTTSASRLRQNEAVRNTDAAMDIEQIGNFAKGQYDADQLGIASAGVQNGWMQAGGQLLSGIGKLGLSGGFGSKGEAPAPIDSMAEAASNANRMWPAAMSPTQYTAAGNSAKLWNAPPITF
jgi:hypothetical protein